MATYEIKNGSLVYSGTNIPAPKATGTYITPRTLYATKLREAEYKSYAAEKVKQFQEGFTQRQAERETAFKAGIAVEQKKITAKEKAKRQIELGGSSDVKLMEQVQKKREAYYNHLQERKVNEFNAETARLFEAGKAATTREIEAAQPSFTYQEPIGGYTEVSTFEGGSQQIIGYSTKNVSQIEASIKADIAKAQAEYEAKWTATGGAYVNIETGQGFSSILSPSQMGEGYVKIAAPNETDRKILEQRTKEILGQVATQKKVWETTGGTFIEPYGGLFSSAKTMTELNLELDLKPFPKNYFKTDTQTRGLNYYASFGKQLFSGYTKIGNIEETDLNLLNQRAFPIIEQGRKSYQFPQFIYETPIIENISQQIITPIEILTYQTPVQDILGISFERAEIVRKETETFLRSDPWLNTYFWGKGTKTGYGRKDIPYGVSLLAGTGEFYKSIGGEFFRNYVLQLTADPKVVGTVPIGLDSSSVYNQGFTRERIQQASTFGYTTGRLVTGGAGYFTPAAPIFATMDISQAKTPEEVIAPLLIVGGATVAVKGGVKLLEYGALKSSAILGGSIVKTGPIIKFSMKTPQYLEYAAVGAKYAAPIALGGYGAYQISQATPSLYSSDAAVRKEAERQLFVSLGAGYFGGVGGEYVGTETVKMINPKITYELVMQGGSSIGKLSPEGKVFFKEAYQRAYGKELPGDVQVVTKVKSYKIKDLEILQEFSPKVSKKIARITEQTIKQYGEDLYLGGSGGIVPQTTLRKAPRGKIGDIDVFLGTKDFAVALVKNLNKGVKVKGFKAQLIEREGKISIDLYKSGKSLFKTKDLEFANITVKDLSLTKGQLTKFGEPFQTTRGAFIKTPEGYKLFNIREQLRGKIEGYYFAGRTKDITDIGGIVKGTKKAAKLYKEYKITSILLDERAIVLPGKWKVGGKNQTGFDTGFPKQVWGLDQVKTASKLMVSQKGVFKDLAYKPYTSYSLPKYSKYALFRVYKTPYQAQYPVNYVRDYLVGYPRTYQPSYQKKYFVDYIPTYTPSYEPSYTPEYTPSYTPEYTPSYTPTYTPTYTPSYTPTYLPKYTPSYTPPYKPKYTPPYTPPPTKLIERIKLPKYKEKKLRFYLKPAKTRLYKTGDISNLILPIKTDWLKALKYTYQKRPKIQTIKLLPTKRKELKKIGKLLGFNFERLF